MGSQPLSSISQSYDANGNKIDLLNNLLTENLAQIFIKQGKLQKAINIYNELICKFPEKKAYFVSCIEELKNT